MKHNIIILLFGMLLISICCSTSKTNSISNCNENITFKNSYFLSIQKVENYTLLGKGSGKDFNEGLDFISKYTHVSRKDMLNYSGTYTHIEIFKKDREVWLTWYEENKCSNIQFKE